MSTPLTSYYETISDDEPMLSNSGAGKVVGALVETQDSTPRPSLLTVESKHVSVPQPRRKRRLTSSPLICYERLSDDEFVGGESVTSKCNTGTGTGVGAALMETRNDTPRPTLTQVGWNHIDVPQPRRKRRMTLLDRGVERTGTNKRGRARRTLRLRNGKPSNS